MPSPEPSHGLRQRRPGRLVRRVGGRRGSHVPLEAPTGGRDPVRMKPHTQRRCSDRVGLTDGGPGAAVVRRSPATIRHSSWRDAKAWPASAWRGTVLDARQEIRRGWLLDDLSVYVDEVLKPQTRKQASLFQKRCARRLRPCPEGRDVSKPPGVMTFRPRDLHGRLVCPSIHVGNEHRQERFNARGKPRNQVRRGRERVRVLRESRNVRDRRAKLLHEFEPRAGQLTRSRGPGKDQVHSPTPALARILHGALGRFNVVLGHDHAGCRGMQPPTKTAGSLWISFVQDELRAVHRMEDSAAPGAPCRTEDSATESR